MGEQMDGAETNGTDKGTANSALGKVYKDQLLGVDQRVTIPT